MSVFDSGYSELRKSLLKREGGECPIQHYSDVVPGFSSSSFLYLSFLAAIWSACF